MAVVLRVVAGVHHDLLGEEGGSVLVPDEIDTLALGLVIILA